MGILERSEKPIIGVTGYSRERFFAYDLIRKARAKLPEATIIVGGRHFGYLAEETLTELPEVDVVVRGEGEVTFKEVCDAVHAGGDFTGLLGTSYRDDSGAVHHNPDRPLERNLDLFRTYDTVTRAELYPVSLLGHTKIDHRNHYFPVHATRGCPNKCVFCSLTSSLVRFRSIDSVIQEIKDKIKATGVRNVSFTDSSLTLKKGYLTELCNAILEHDLNIRWRCYSRVNIDIEVLKLMREAGLDSVEIGLETGSPKVLKAIRKNITHEQVERFVRLAHELGIKVWVFCMVSLPEETYEDAMMTVDFVRKLSPYIDAAGMQTTRITPDAALFPIAQEKGILPKDFSWFQPFETEHTVLSRPWDRTLPIYTEHLSVQQIQEIHDKFKRVTSTELATFSYLVQGLKYNLRPRALKQLTPAAFLKKAEVAARLFMNSIRNTRRSN
jgi:radical SAM superfamily enzyme YgiQ (UPF0313 family)